MQHRISIELQRLTVGRVQSSPSVVLGCCMVGKRTASAIFKRTLSGVDQRTDITELCSDSHSKDSTGSPDAAKCYMRHHCGYRHDKLVRLTSGMGCTRAYFFQSSGGTSSQPTVFPSGVLAAGFTRTLTHTDINATTQEICRGVQVTNPTIYRINPGRKYICARSIIASKI